MDGLSYAPMLTAAAGVNSIPWKDTALIEYLSIRPTDTIRDVKEWTEEAKEDWVSAYGYRTDASTNQPVVSKNDEFCFIHEEFCIKNKELRLKNKDFSFIMMNCAVPVDISHWQRHGAELSQP